MEHQLNRQGIFNSPVSEPRSNLAHQVGCEQYIGAGRQLLSHALKARAQDGSFWVREPRLTTALTGRTNRTHARSHALVRQVDTSLVADYKRVVKHPLDLGAVKVSEAGGYCSYELTS